MAFTTYPHNGNEAFNDKLIDLIEGNAKYELAYKIVGLVEAKRHYKVVSEEFTKQLNRLKAKAEAYIDAIGVTWTPEKWAYKVVNLLVNRTNEAVAHEEAPALAAGDTEVAEQVDETTEYEWEEYDYTNYYAYDNYYASYKEALAVS